MHTLMDRRDGTRRFHIWLNMPERPMCWLFGHKPHMYELTSKYTDTAYWVECSRCLRRSTRQVPRGVAINIPGIEQDTDRRSGWQGNTVEAGVEVVTHRPRPEFSFRFHIGDRWSETPFDGHLTIMGNGVYFSTSFGSKVAELIGPRRDLSLSVHGGQLWWKLWLKTDRNGEDVHRCDGWRKPKVWPWSAGRRKHRGWMCLRDGNIDLNPITALWGHRSYDYEDIDQVTALVPVGEFPGDEYEVQWTLQHQTRARQHGPSWSRRRSDDGLVAKWDCRPGIPVRNHDWKGDEILGSAERVTQVDGWLAEATASLAERVKKDRVRYRYRPPTTTEPTS